MCAELIRDQDSLEFSLICLHTFITVFVNNLIIYITLDSYFLLFYEKGVFVLNYSVPKTHATSLNHISGWDR